MCMAIQVSRFVKIRRITPEGVWRLTRETTRPRAEEKSIAAFAVPRLVRVAETYVPRWFVATRCSCASWTCAARRGVAWRGAAWLGLAWRGAARSGAAVELWRLVYTAAPSLRSRRFYGAWRELMRVGVGLSDYFRYENNSCSYSDCTPSDASFLTWRTSGPPTRGNVARSGDRVFKISVYFVRLVKLIFSNYQSDILAIAIIRM